MKSKHLYYSSLILFVFFAIFNSITKTGISGDGVQWLFHIIDDKEFIGVHPSLRYSTWIPQAPLVLLGHLLPFDTLIKIAIETFILCYNLLTPLALIFSWVLLPKKYKYLIAFPIITEIAILTFTKVFIVGVSYEAATMLWPFLFLIKFNANRKFFLPIYLFCLLYFAFSYEIIVIIFLICAVYFMYLRKDFTLKQRLLYSLLSLGASLIILAIFVFSILPDQRGHIDGFFSSIMLSDFKQIIYSLGQPTLFISILLFGTSRLKKRGIILLSIILSSFFMYALVGSNQITTGYYIFRTLVIPITLIVFIAVLLLNDSFHKSRIPFSILISLLIPYLYYNIEANINTITINKIFANRLSKSKPGCNLLSKEEYEKFYQDRGISDWSLPYYSVIIQKKVTIDRFFGVKGNHQCSRDSLDFLNKKTNYNFKI